MSDDTVKVPREATWRLILAADSYGVRFLDSDDMSDEAQELQDATEAMKDLLSAAPTEAHDAGWLDISTAPKDGTTFIAYSEDVSGTSGLKPFVSLCVWHPDAGFCTCELREPTRWIPFGLVSGSSGEGG